MAKHGQSGILPGQFQAKCTNGGCCCRRPDATGSEAHKQAATEGGRDSRTSPAPRLGEGSSAEGMLLAWCKVGEDIKPALVMLNKILQALQSRLHTCEASAPGPVCGQQVYLQRSWLPASPLAAYFDRCNSNGAEAQPETSAQLV